MIMILNSLRDESSSLVLSAHATFLPHTPEDGINIAYYTEPGLRGNLDPPLDKEEDDYVDPSPVPDTSGGGGQPAPIPH